MSGIYHPPITRIQRLPSPLELKNQLAITPEQQTFIQESRQQIQNILDGKDSRLLLIVGPCSIHNTTAAQQFAHRLKELTSSIDNAFFPIMRVHFEKPRSSLGWKGLLYDPFLNGSNDIPTGLHWSRKLLLELASLEVPAAAEFLDPLSLNFFADLISWGCIGARTAASQIHRQLVSALPMPVSFKNSIDGNIDIAVNGVVAASAPHSFLGIDDEGLACVIHSLGNPYAHITLRGGESKPNYDQASIEHALQRLEQANLPTRLLIDCSHDNSNRQYDRQCHVFDSVIQQLVNGNRSIRGLILESNLAAGNQPISLTLDEIDPFISLTDACLDWITTESLIKKGHELISSRSKTLRK